MAGSGVASSVATGAATERDPGCPHDALPAVQATERQWQLLASELPAAMLSVSGALPTISMPWGRTRATVRSSCTSTGTKWGRAAHGAEGRFVVGAGARGAGRCSWRARGEPCSGTTERRSRGWRRPALEKQTVYGVWGASGEKLLRGGERVRKKRVRVALPRRRVRERDLAARPAEARRSGRRARVLQSVRARGTDVWVVGGGGAILHRKGAALRSAVVPTTTKETLFTVHGVGDQRGDATARRGGGPATA